MLSDFSFKFLHLPSAAHYCCQISNATEELSRITFVHKIIYFYLESPKIYLISFSKDIFGV